MNNESIILKALAHYRAVQEWTVASERSSRHDRENSADRIVQIDKAVAEIEGRSGQ